MARDLNGRNYSYVKVILYCMQWEEFYQRILVPGYSDEVLSLSFCIVMWTHMVWLVNSLSFALNRIGFFLSWRTGYLLLLLNLAKNMWFGLGNAWWCWDSNRMQGKFQYPGYPCLTWIRKTPYRAIHLYCKCKLSERQQKEELCVLTISFFSIHFFL